MAIRKILFLFLTFTAGVIINSPSFATGVANKILIDTIKVTSDGKVAVTFVSNLQTPITSCEVNSNTVVPSVNSFTFTVASEGEKLMLSNLLAAKLGNKKIYAYGTGACAAIDGSTYAEILYFVSII